MFEEKDKKKNEEFGEFVPTYFGWIPLDEQKKRAEELDKKTKWVLHIRDIPQMCGFWKI